LRLVHPRRDGLVTHFRDYMNPAALESHRLMAAADTRQR
jgi:hypothetical protein